MTPERIWVHIIRAHVEAARLDREGRPWLASLRRRDAAHLKALL